MRFIEIAGPLLLEAAHDGKIASDLKELTDQFPGNKDTLESQVKQAKSLFGNKQGKMLWFMNQVMIPNAENTNEISTVLINLRHYLDQRIPKIQDYVFDPMVTLDQVYSEFFKFETEHQKTQNEKRGITPKPEDEEVFKFPDGTAWWYLPRAFDDEEGRSGKHCGNVEGHSHPGQRILSLRNNKGQVILTFVARPNFEEEMSLEEFEEGYDWDREADEYYLGEMKAKANQLPQPKYYPHIYKLLTLNAIVGFSKHGTYLPRKNFNLLAPGFAKYLDELDQEKPKLIQDQVSLTPFDLVNNPNEKIRSEYQHLAIRARPGIKPLFSGQDLEHWQIAVANDPTLIFKVPVDLEFPDWEEIAAEQMTYDDLEDLLEVNPGRIINSKNNEFIESLVINYPFIVPDHFPRDMPNFKNWCQVAAGRQMSVISKLEEKGLLDQELFDACFKPYLNDPNKKVHRDSISVIPERFRTDEIYKRFIISDPSAAREMTPDVAKRLMGFAIEQGWPKDFVDPKIGKFPELEKTAVRLPSVNQDVLIYKIPDPTAVVVDHYFIVSIRDKQNQVLKTLQLTASGVLSAIDDTSNAKSKYAQMHASWGQSKKVDPEYANELSAILMNPDIKITNVSILDLDDSVLRELVQKNPDLVDNYLIGNFSEQGKAPDWLWTWHHELKGAIKTGPGHVTIEHLSPFIRKASTRDDWRDLILKNPKIIKYVPANHPAYAELALKWHVDRWGTVDGIDEKLLNDPNKLLSVIPKDRWTKILGSMEEGSGSSTYYKNFAKAVVSQSLFYLNYVDFPDQEIVDAALQHPGRESALTIHRKFRTPENFLTYVKNGGDIFTVPTASRTQEMYQIAAKLNPDIIDHLPPEIRQGLTQVQESIDELWRILRLSGR